MSAMADCPQNWQGHFFFLVKYLTCSCSVMKEALYIGVILAGTTVRLDITLYLCLVFVFRPFTS